MDPISFILLALFGVLGIFVLVRIVKYASRTVDREQTINRRPADTPAPDGQPRSASVQETPATKPKEVKLGMTPAEVEAALGSPETKADLGEKVLYRYKDMTVEFRAGKLTDAR